jgi:hypothetical protein
VRIVRIEAERRPDVDPAARRKVELGGHDAHHGVRLRIELNRPADHAWRTAEMTLPERAAQDGDAVVSRLPFLRRERAPENGVVAEQGEQAGRGTHARHVERLTRAGERVPQLTERRHRLHGF